MGRPVLCGRAKPCSARPHASRYVKYSPRLLSIKPMIKPWGVVIRAAQTKGAAETLRFCKGLWRLLTS